MKDTRKLLVLNYSGDPSEEFIAFLVHLGLEIIEREDYKADCEYTHILISGEEDFHFISQTFSAVAKNISLVALSQVANYESFVISGGRLVVDPSWVQDSLGKATLEKFFKGIASVYLDENFPQIKQGSSFKVTNHLKIGHELDRLASFAHENDSAVVNLRTFVDHALYYLVYLKQAGIAGMPFEVDYGHSGNEMIVQVHLSVKNFVAEYLLDSFGAPNGRDPLRYLLNICANSSDFFEIQYIESASKLVLCGIWQNKKSKQSLHFSGLMLNKIFTTNQLEDIIREQIKLVDEDYGTQKIEELNSKPLPGSLLEMVMPEMNQEGYLKEHPVLARTLVAFIIDQWNAQHPESDVNQIKETDIVSILSQFSDQDEISKLIDPDRNFLHDRVRKHNVSKAYEDEIQRVRENLQSDEEFQKIISENLAEKIAEKVTGALNTQDLNQLVEGGFELPDVAVAVTVKGESGEEETAIKVKGSSARDELVQKISGKVEEDLESQLVKGSKPEIDDFVFRISQGLGEEVKGDWKVKSGITQKVAPDKIRLRLNRFADSMGQTLENLSTQDLKLFSQTELPDLIESLVQVDEEFVIPETVLPELPDYEFRTKFQENLNNKINQKFPGKTAADVTAIISSEEQEALLREVIKDSVQGAILANKDLKEDDLVFAISNTLHEDKNDVRTIISGSNDEVKKIEGEQVIQRLFNNENPLANDSGTTSQDAANTILIKKIKEMEAEAAKTKKMLEASLVEIRTLKESQSQVAAIEKEAKVQAIKEMNSLEAIQNEPMLSVEDKVQMIQSLNASNEPDPRIMEKLRQALEREQKIVIAAKNAENEIKKFKIELQSREVLFKQQIDKANRASKSKDMVVNKAKESLTLVITKKDQEIDALRNKISSLVGSQAAAESANQVQQIKKLEKEQQSLTRLAEMYKTKLMTLTEKFKQQSENSNPKMNEEYRKLTMENKRLEVSIQNFQKQMEKASSKIQLDQSELQRVRAEKARLEEALKSSLSTTGPVSAAQPTTNSAEAQKIKELQSELAQYAQKNSKYEISVKDLESKVAELTSMLAKQQGGSNDQSAKKALQLEVALKKISSDFTAANNALNDAKKDQQKAKLEITALKNTIERMKKDMEKVKSKKAA